MKNITKLITATAFVAAIFCSANLQAQSVPLGEIRFDVGLEAGAPAYNARTLSSVMGGATGRFQMGLGDNLTVIATSGYYNFFNKTSTINGTSVKEPGLGIVPLKAGLKGYLGGGVYLAGEVGLGFETSNDLATHSKDVKNILAGGLGYASHSWDIGARYESFTGQSFNYGLIALRVAYGFKL